MSDRETSISQLHPAMARIVFAHLANGDDVSIGDGSVMVEFTSNQRISDGPAIDLAQVDPEAILSARFNGEPVDDTVLAALTRRALLPSDSGVDDPVDTTVTSAPRERGDVEVLDDRLPRDCPQPR